ncbi:MAG: cytochrome oxidase Cu insertion factor (SCO1/SenC/PrrC family) [Chlamydiales bacterium]|jgi:cytochrome oxidase Cu insertion factor (SCO1/SenC/PrrC family)
MKTVDRSPLALLLAGVALLASCGSETSSSTALYSSVAPQVVSSHSSLPFSWPPTRGEAYPDVALLDHRGDEVQLSSFKGKVLLVELIGMT